jgi:hypothetical protein
VEVNDGQAKGVILFQSEFCSGGEGPALEHRFEVIGVVDSAASGMRTPFAMASHRFPVSRREKPDSTPVRR